MRIIALGDTHGRSDWKRIVEKETFDKIVFIGDYFDSNEGIGSEFQKKNFMEITEYKKSHPDKVILLFGNHDFHYTTFCNGKYTGYQFYQENFLRELIMQAYSEKLFQMCWIHQDILFSHAGITKTWCKNNSIDLKNLEDSVNHLFYSNPGVFNFSPGPSKSRQGDDPEQSPIWVRPPSLRADRVEGYIQIAGHTLQKNIDLAMDVILIDALGTSHEYLVIEDGGIAVEKVRW